jgi:hypothetical protein
MLPSVIGAGGAGDRGISGAPLVRRHRVRRRNRSCSDPDVREIEARCKRRCIRSDLIGCAAYATPAPRVLQFAAAAPSAENKSVPGTYWVLQLGVRQAVKTLGRRHARNKSDSRPRVNRIIIPSPRVLPLLRSAAAQSVAGGGSPPWCATDHAVALDRVGRRPVYFT